MGYLIHVANVLYFLSYVVKDILWLRVLTVVAGTFLLAFYYFRPDPLWPAIYWNLVFSAINVYQIYALILERRPVRLSEEEQKLYQLAFRTLTPREFVKLLGLARWEDAPAAARIVETGRSLERTMVIVAGRAAVEVGGRKVAELEDGQFIGEMSFLTGEAPNADVVTLEATRYVSWPQDELRRVLKSNADLRAAWQMAIGTDLIGKLRAA
jgi:hypothetical protein